MRATYTRTEGVWHLFAAYELGEDKLFGHIKPRKTRARFLEFCRYLRSLYPLSVRIAIICDNVSPHLTTAKDCWVGAWAQANNAEIAYTPGECVLVKQDPRSPRCGTSPSTAPTTPTTRSRAALSAGTSSGATTTPTTNDCAASSTGLRCLKRHKWQREGRPTGGGNPFGRQARRNACELAA
jgi:hypothetical protein